MCECGCTMNDEKLTFPGPGKSFYILTLAGHCEDCDAAPGVTIEHIKPDHPLWRDYKRGEFISGPLNFNQWPDGPGVAIVTGMRKHEFVAAMTKHLEGLDSRMLGDGGKMDEDGAEVVAEEMYADSQVQPHVVRPPGVPGLEEH